MGRRVAAYVIDALISTAVSIGAWFAGTKSLAVSCDQVINGSAGVNIGGKCRGFIAGENGQTTFLIIVLVASFILFWALPALTGFSPGKAIVGIRIIRRDGRNPGFGRVFLRGLLYIVDGFPYIIPNLVGFLVANGDKAEHKRIGDRAAGTLVVDKSAAGRPFAPPQQQFATSPQAFNAGPSGPPQAPPQSQPAPSAGSPAPGWYDDPQRQARLRYWDGSAWTSHTSG